MAETIIETPRFPDDISYGSTGGPGYSTDVITVNSGVESRNINWTQARHTYNIAFGVRDQTYLNELVAFFHAVKGKAYGFRYKDWSDFTSLPKEATIDQEISELDQLIGVGDGSNKVFQLVKNYTYGLVTTREINKPVNGTVKIAVDGIDISNFSVNYTTGVVTLVSAPGDTLEVTAGYEFDVPCRFDTDELSINLEMYQHGTTDVPLVELRI
ncbi:MAG: DUF2460 domain-containing protein [Desulfobacteraceae bacterium]|nr:DUF2460 domain-containing protein [Desulfobacteraceae bacterium]